MSTPMVRMPDGRLIVRNSFVARVAIASRFARRWARDGGDDDWIRVVGPAATARALTRRSSDARGVDAGR